MSIAHAGGESRSARPGTRNTAVRTINRAIRNLDLTDVEAQLLAAEDADLGVEVCDASLKDWERYVESEDQALMSRAMKWYNGKYEAIREATGTRIHHLVGRGSTFVANMRRLEPDLSYGPHPRVGAALPAALLGWDDFHTLKIEIGVSRGWSFLNRKAEEWRQFPGVQYVLSIRLSPGLQVRQYRLDSVVNGGFEIPRMQIAGIGNPTLVAFDSHRLLGLPVNAPLPAGFSQPVTIDLFQMVEDAIASR